MGDEALVMLAKETYACIEAISESPSTDRIYNAHIIVVW